MQITQLARGESKKTQVLKQRSHEVEGYVALSLEYEIRVNTQPWRGQLFILFCANMSIGVRLGMCDRGVCVLCRIYAHAP